MRRLPDGSGRIAFTALLCLAACMMLWQTMGLGRAARLAPIWAIFPTTGLLLLQLVLDLRPAWGRRLGRSAVLARPQVRRSRPGVEEAASPAAGGERRPSREAVAFGALLALTALALAVGLVLAAPLFLLGQLVIGSRLSWWRAAALALAAFILLYLGFPNLLGIELPPGLLLDLRSPVWL
jgi:Tripartite tricarboxylate transporter TctB family